MRNLFSDDNSGYRLKTLQILNWGVFDSTVKTFEFNNKSTILTGYNGSGKTTCVDAILTLLIPSNLRWYNLSSESVRKRERDVENYVLGAWGNTGDSGTKFLRDKNTKSILNGIFSDPVMERELSLLQVRYFVGDRLETKYAITEKELRLEKANYSVSFKGAKISSDGKWRKILTEEFNTRFFDSFTSYKSFFMDKFGFRSDNALKLFSQTVGMKVLGDMTTFVRTYMLEDKTPEKEFRDLDEEFIHLLSIYRDLRKAQLKLEKLEVIHNSIEVWRNKEEEKNKAEINKTGELLWFYSTAIEYGEKEIKEKERSLKDIEVQINNHEIEIQRVRDIINTLSSDTSSSYLEKLERDIESLKRTLSDTVYKYNEYKKLITKLKDEGADIAVPDNRDSFYKTKDDIPLLEKKIREKNQLYEDKIEEYSISLNDIKRKIEEYEETLEYLSKKETNIPKEYDGLRERLSKELSISSDNLPFLGELIDIKDSAEEWKTSLLKLLNSKALYLLVSKENEEKVATYLDSNDLELDIKTIIVEDRIFNEKKDNPFSNMIEIREKNNPYKKWLQNEIANLTDFDPISSITEALSCNNAILPSSLIKDDDKLIKYDGKESSGLTKNYLGWDNKKKREILEQWIFGLKQERDDFENKIKVYKIRRGKADSVLAIFSRLNDEYDDWNALDSKPVEKILRETEEKKKEFLENNKDIYEKKKQLESEKRHLDVLEKEKTQLIRDQRDIELAIKDFNTNIENFKKQTQELDWNKEAYISFKTSYKNELSFTTFEDIYLIHNELYKKIDESVIRLNKEELTSRNTLEKQMQNFINPVMKPEDKDYNWSGDYNDLVAEAETAEDYEKEYLKIKDEEIYSTQAKFDDYLERSLSQDIGKLNEKIYSWDKEINVAIRILNRNLAKIPFDKEYNSHNH